MHQARAYLWPLAVMLLIYSAGCQHNGLALLPRYEGVASAGPGPARPAKPTKAQEAPPVTRPHKRIDAEAVKPKQPAVTMTEEEKSWYVLGTRPWRHIVVHHSATDRGNAGTFDVSHRMRGWDEMGYHFVITNGRGGTDGAVEIGSRWLKQKWGAHCGGTPDNEYNNHGIGICLVGNFTRHMPSGRQLSALKRLVTFLIRVYSVPPENVMGHRDGPNCATACPGELLHRHVWGPFRREISVHTASAK